MPRSSLGVSDLCHTIPFFFFFFLDLVGQITHLTGFVQVGDFFLYAYDCDCYDIDIVQVRAFKKILPLDPFAREPRL